MLWNVQHDFNKIGVIGLLPVSLGSPPSSPVVGQMYTDSTTGRVKLYNGSTWIFMDQVGTEQSANKGVASGYAGLDGSAKVPIAQLPTGFSSTTVMLGSASLDQIAVPVGSVSMNGQRLTNLGSAAAGTDAVSRTFLYATRLDQLAVPTANIDLGSNRLVNLGAPVSSTDAARLADVQNAQAGIDLKPSVRAASTSNVTTSTIGNGAVLDGVTLATGDRIALMGQTTGSQNGLYTVPATAGTLPRTTDSINPNSLWFVEEGIANHDTAWMVTNDGAITLGTTALTIAQFGSGSMTYTGTANRITVTGTVIDIASTYAGQASITTVGTISSGVWQGTPVAIAYGGTGASSAAAALTALGAATVVSVAIPALTAGTEATITHGIGRKNVQIVVRRVSDDVEEEFETRPLSTTTFGITSAVAKVTGVYYAIVTG